MDHLQREHPKFWPEVTKKCISAYKSSNISEARQDRTKVTIEDQ